MRDSSMTKYDVYGIGNAIVDKEFEVQDSFFTEHGTAYEILGGTEGFEITNNGSCPSEGLTDQRWFFHEWGSYTIRIDNSAENPAWFMAVVE